MTVEELDAWLVDNLRTTFKAASDMEIDDLKIPRKSKDEHGCFWPLTCHVQEITSK